MRQFFALKLAGVATTVLAACLMLGAASGSFAQSKPQVPTEGPKGTQKKNPRPAATPQNGEPVKPEDKAEVVTDDEILKIAASIVNVDAVVYRKKGGQIVTGLKKENFAIFENGVKQEITNFSMPEAPITISVVVEFSKWTEMFGRASGGGFEPGTYEVIRPVAYFVSNFIKPPNDYASIIAFDMRPTPITDFTNDPNRLRRSVDLLLKNYPAFRENNVWDALNFSIKGGKADSVVLEDSEEDWTEYGGMAEVKSPRKAILLVASGIDTFSKMNYDKIRKVVQSAGVPVYIVGTGNMFYKRYEHMLPTIDSISGLPGRMTFIQADNALKTIAKESGGAYFPITFEGDAPGALQNINSLLRNQYSLAYDVGERNDGKKYNLEVKVDVNGDGVYEDKEYVVQHRPYYIAPGVEVKEKKKKDKN